MFEIPRRPLRHRTLARAAEEDPDYAKPKGLVFELTDRTRRFFSALHLRYFRAQERYERKERYEHKRYRQPLPVLLSESEQKQRAEQNDRDHAPRVHRMELAHFAFGVVGGYRRDHGADEDFGKTAGHGKKDRAEDKTQIDGGREDHGRERVQGKTRQGERGHYAENERDIELIRKERENKIDTKLRAEIDEDQKPQKGIRDPVKVVKSDKKQRR